MSVQGEIERINSNVQTTLSTIAETGVSVGNTSDALPVAAAALANEKADKTKRVAITFSAASWRSGADAFEQTVTVAGGTENSLIALQPTITQIASLSGAGVSALVVDNDSGTFTAKALGAAPSEDMTMQATVTELHTAT